MWFTCIGEVVSNIIEERLSGHLNQGIKHNCLLWLSNNWIHLMQFFNLKIIILAFFSLLSFQMLF